ncbi:MAG: 2OG-Fe(II) oxygenase [Hyphomicrobiaceae bacterium]
MDQMIAPNGVAQQFLTCLANSDRRTSPYRYWLLTDALPAETVDGIASLPFSPPSGASFDGRRETNNSTRVYFSPENQARFAVCREVASAFKHPLVMSAIEKETGTDLTQGQLRVEYCQDVDGFWLEPHVDISVKLFTMLVYLSDEPELYDAGTDIYDASPEHKLVGTAPYERNKGLIFIPGTDTWHGFTPRAIRGVRKSIIINYVTPAWRDTFELA